MFLGSINQEVRSVLVELAPGLVGRDIYVGCSGNFTVERVLHASGLSRFHGNDISLYSSAVGHYLAGTPLQIEVQDPDYDWLKPWMSPGLPAVCTLLICTEMFKYMGRDTPYHTRMAAAYAKRFPDLHAATTVKALKSLEGLSLLSFVAGDVVAFAEQVPDDACFLVFPPYQKGDYEHMYQLMDQVFAWPSPQYPAFDDDRFDLLVAETRKKAAWVTMWDQPVPQLDGALRAMIQTSIRSKPVYVYSNIEASRLAQPKQVLETVPVGRLEGEVTEPLRIVNLTYGQYNSLRSQYMPVTLPAASAQHHFGLLTGEKLVGAFSFVTPRAGGYWCDIYKMSDFAVAPTCYARLAKLVLAAVLSHEMKAILEQAFSRRVRTLGTTAFTRNKVSMKYRGIFELHNRNEGSLNYLGRMGKWSLEEGLCWWQKNHSQTVS